MRAATFVRVLPAKLSVRPELVEARRGAEPFIRDCRSWFDWAHHERK